MEQNPRLISSRCASTPSSSWTEYLRLTTRFGIATLDSCQYEVLGDTGRYTKENGETDIPETIDGKAVFGVEGEYVVGGELQKNGNINIRFDEATLNGALDIVKSKFELDDEALRAISAAVSMEGMLADESETAAEIFAWQKRRERQRGVRKS